MWLRALGKSCSLVHGPETDRVSSSCRWVLIQSRRAAIVLSCSKLSPNNDRPGTCIESRAKLSLCLNVQRDSGDAGAVSGNRALCGFFPVRASASFKKSLML
jgi:hypothetical protein